MVPLKPNELRRDSTLPLPRTARGSTSTGIRNDLDDTSDDRCAFSLEAPGPLERTTRDAQFQNPRSCALTATTLADRGTTTRDARPAAAAAASRWPTFDFSDAQCACCEVPPSLTKHRAPIAAPTWVAGTVERVWLPSIPFYHA